LSIKEVQKVAQNDNYTNDKEYNKGLRLVRESIGFSVLYMTEEVKYWMLCNNIRLTQGR